MDFGDRMKALWLGTWFLRPYYERECEMIHCETPECAAEHANAATLAFCMNGALAAGLEFRLMVQECQKRKVPVCWMTCEDPNGYLGFVREAQIADFVFTCCRTMIPHYRRDCGHNRVYWLPLAASEALHQPMPLALDAADLVLLGNHYAHWPAKVRLMETILKPLLATGRTLALHTYPTNEWPPEIAALNRGATSCYDVARFYPEGRIACGASCQAGAGIDDFAGTTMTSQRTFEALACTKPYLTVPSDAYEPLGFRNGEHMAWVKSAPEALDAYDLLAGPEGAAMAERGRAFVMQHHTYRHRLQRILDAVDGKAKPEELE